jgi:hypothetical protein
MDKIGSHAMAHGDLLEMLSFGDVMLVISFLVVVYWIQKLGGR